MSDKEKIVINSNYPNVGDSNIIFSSSNMHFSVEPSTEKDYDISVMTGNNNEENSSTKGSDEK